MPQINCNKHEFHVTNPNKDAIYCIDIRTNKPKEPLRVVSTLTLKIIDKAGWKLLMGVNNNTRPTFFIQKTADILTVIRVFKRYPKAFNDSLNVDIRRFKMVVDPTVGMAFVPIISSSDIIDETMYNLNRYLSSITSIEIKMIEKGISFNKVQRIPLDEVDSDSFTVFRVFK